MLNKGSQDCLTSLNGPAAKVDTKKSVKYECAGATAFTDEC